MTDPFERFLSSSLASAERLPDRRFVAGVQARILLEDRLARERRALVINLLKQLVALLSVGAAVWSLVHAAPIADQVRQFPATGLAVLLISFALLVGLFTRAPSAGYARVAI